MARFFSKKTNVRVASLKRTPKIHCKMRQRYARKTGRKARTKLLSLWEPVERPVLRHDETGTLLPIGIETSAQAREKKLDNRPTGCSIVKNSPESMNSTIKNKTIRDGGSARHG